MSFDQTCELDINIICTHRIEWLSLNHKQLELWVKHKGYSHPGIILFHAHPQVVKCTCVKFH